MCSFHARLREEIGTEAVEAGDYVKRRNGRQRVPVAVESEPLETAASGSPSPASVRPALAVTAAEQLDVIRRVLLEAATSTSRESWATCCCPECSHTFRQPITVADHNARVRAVEALLREGLGRVGDADVLQPRMPKSITDVRTMSWDELCLVFATEFAPTIRSVAQQGDAELRAELETLEPETRAILTRALAEIA